MATQTTKPRVLIVGAGLGGLTLAQCLRKQNIPFEIFERDTGPKSRTSGWCIALHIILDEFIASVPEDMPPFKEAVNHLLPLNLTTQIGIYHRGVRLGVESAPDYPIIRANRFLFRQWLSTKIPIQWGKKVTRVEETEAEARVLFEDGTTATGDIIVGADGVNSVVREHVLKRPNKDTLHLVPALVLVGETSVSGEAFERQLSLGHSAYAVAGPESSTYFLFAGLRQVSPDGNSGQYYWFIVERDEGLDKEDHWVHLASQSEKHEHAIEIGKTFDPKFSEIIRLTPPSGMWSKPLIVRDAELQDLPVGRTTLLGDAVHPMTPFRGEGGVHAIRDSLNLGKALGQLKSTDFNEIESVMDPYQKEVLERGVAAVRRCRNAQNINAGQEGERGSWGKVAVEMKEENISLQDCRT